MAEQLRVGAEEPPSPAAEIVDGAVRRLVLVRREIIGTGDSQEPGALARGEPFRRYSLATQRALREAESPSFPDDTAA